MDNFNALIAIIERLLAPDGCPWDREQTLASMRGSIIEEAYEVVEAIDLNETDKIEEELGDLLFLIVFLSKLGEQDRRFTLQRVVKGASDKLIRRHPHIFGEALVKDSEEVRKQWEAIKQTEKGEDKDKPKSTLDNIPKDLPTLFKAQKMLQKFQKAGFDWKKESADAFSEDAYAKELWDLVSKGALNGLEPETAFRKLLCKLERSFRSWESQQA